VPVIFGCRKWATNKDRLERAGFPELVGAPEVPSVLLDVSIVAAPLPVPEEAETLPLATQQPEEEPMSLPYDAKKLRNLYREVLVEKPEISNKDAYAEARLLGPMIGIRVGSERPDLLADLRKELNLVRPKNNYTVGTANTSEVPLPLLDAVPAALRPVEKPAASKDVRELVQLLRMAMEVEGLESLTVTKDSVKFRRVVIEEGAFDV